jgi:1-deoxy-D-xylulose-5-phosphate reductoisomerase
MANSLQQVTILGSTGSIGASTLDVIARYPERFAVYALTARNSVQTMYEQCLRYQPRFAVMCGAPEAEQLSALLRQAGSDCQVRSEAAGLCEVAAAVEVDVVMAAIVGAAGLEPTLAAVCAGKRVLLANKESLVMAGQLFMNAVREHGATLLPIDSEHNAIYQCLPLDDRGRVGKLGVRKVLLTASGGPFRLWSTEQMRVATPDQACAHPNWKMGRKISVDSATLMNKGLELVEACWLFDLNADAIEVVVHPQSIVHSMVQYVDGSVLAQLGNPDMRTPIAYGLAWPERIDSGVAELDIIATAQLDFEAPDYVRFPCLGLAQEAVRRGGLAMTALNAANEEAVAAFLRGKIGFTAIPQIIESVMTLSDSSEPDSLDVVKQADACAREGALAAIADVAYK